MSYESFQTSNELSRPVELYEFNLAGSLYYLTSGPEDITVGGQLYQSAAIERGALVINDSERSPLKVKIDATQEYISKFIALTPSTQSGLVIRMVQLGDLTDVVYLFSGTISSFSYKEGGNVLEVSVEPARKGSEKSSLLYTFSRKCSYALYGADCGVDSIGTSPLGYAYRTDNALVSEVSGRQLVVPQAKNFPVGWFTGGHIEFEYQGEAQSMLIVTHDQDLIELSIPYPTEYLVGGSRITLYAGCDRSYGTCSSRFGNQVRFGGFPSVPSKNPFTSKIQPDA